MANQFLFANFFATELTASIAVGDTTISIPPSAAAKLQNFAGGFYAPLALWDGANPPEIVWCTNNPQTGALTVLRAQEGTSAFAWSAGTQVISALTAAVVNAALAAYNSGQVLTSNYLPLSGGNLSGFLTLAANPISPLHAATKSYVDALGTGPFLPLSGGTLTGNLAMSNSGRITGLLSPSIGSEPANKTYADAIQTLLTNYESDQNGVTASTGSSVAYALATPSGGKTLIDGTKVAFRAHVTSGGSAVTFSVDGTAAKPLRPLVGFETIPGQIKIGGIYTATYRLSSDEWIWTGSNVPRFVTTTGTGAAYLLTTSFSTGTPADGLEVGFSIHTVNTGVCTLTVDGGSPFPLRPRTTKDFVTNQLRVGMTGIARFAGATSEWIVLHQADSLIASLSDVTLTSPVGGQALQYNGSVWTNVSPPSPRGYIDGCILSNDGGSPNTTLDISAGVCRDGGVGLYDIVVSSVTKTTANFVIGSTNGGLDTGAVAVNTWYSVWAILNLSTQATDILFSTSFTSPTMPSGYTAKRYIGAFKTATGTTNILAFTQVGDEFLWAQPVTEINNAAPGTTNAVTLTLGGVPSGFKFLAKIIAVVPAVGAGNSVGLLSSLDTNDIAPAVSTYFNYGMSVTTTAGGAGYLLVRTNTTQQIRDRMTTSSARTITTIGWIDQRGKNA